MHKIASRGGAGASLFHSDISPPLYHIDGVVILDTRVADLQQSLPVQLGGMDHSVSQQFQGIIQCLLLEWYYLSPLCSAAPAVLYPTSLVLLSSPS